MRGTIKRQRRLRGGSRFSRRSDGARVEHDAHRRAEGLRREVLAEARAHGPIVSARPANHSPHAPVLRALLLGLRLVHVRNLLAEVVTRFCVAVPLRLKEDTTPLTYKRTGCFPEVFFTISLL